MNLILNGDSQSTDDPQPHRNLMRAMRLILEDEQGPSRIEIVFAFEERPGPEAMRQVIARELESVDAPQGAWVAAHDAMDALAEEGFFADSD
jgi:hypothetical protein